MTEEVDFVTCSNCETPCYQFELDKRGNVTSAFCAMCGNDDPAEFRLADADESAEAE